MNNKIITHYYIYCNSLVIIYDNLDIIKTINN